MSFCAYWQWCDCGGMVVELAKVIPPAYEGKIKYIEVCIDCGKIF